MEPPRKLNEKGARTRAQLMDAAEQLLLEEGYASVTSRRVGKRAGLAPQLVHYYFGTMEDLFLAVYRRRADQGLERFSRDLAAGPSIGELWRRTRDLSGAAFNTEFVALANHRKEIRSEIARYAERFRALQLEAVARALGELGIPPEQVDPNAVLLIMTGLSQIMALEKQLGVSAGHREAASALERWLEGLERGN